MTDIINFLETYTTDILIVAILVSLLSLLLVFVNIIRTNKIIKKYKRLMRGMNNKNLEALLYSHLESVQECQTRLKDLELDIASLTASMKTCFQRIGIMRYNAFDKTGGEQSFSIALLNEHGRGFVLTGLYGGNSTAIFAKPVINYKPQCRLSPEEEEVLNMAIKQ